MDWLPKIEGKNVAAVHFKTGAKRVLRCAGWQGAQSVSVAGDVFVVACGDGKTRVWSPDKGTLRMLG